METRTADSRATDRRAPVLRSAALGVAMLTAHMLLTVHTCRAHHAYGADSASAGTGVKDNTVEVKLTEWKVELSPARVPPGPVTFHVTNAGSIPHAFEVEGKGIEKETKQIPRGATGTLALTLEPGKYEAYCPIGNGSHKMLGMQADFEVTGTPRAVAATAADGDEHVAQEAHEAKEADEADETHEAHQMHEVHEMRAAGGAGAPPKALEVSGGGPVIQILPGPFPFADSAAAVIGSRPEDQREDLSVKSRVGPYSNNVARITGTISLAAFDRGASGDSVSGVAEIKTQDGARWKVVMDRVQTKDIPDNPRFGGVIMGLFYHGATGVHTPLVPTIQSSLALWAFAHLYRNDQLVTDNAMVHVMLLSRTRRAGDFALDCWDCTRNPIEELQLQVTAAKGEPKFDAPGGFLFVNWEKSSAKRLPSS